MNSDIKRLKSILKEMEVSPEAMAEKLGLTPRSYQTMTARSVKVTPKWVTSFLMAWELANEDLLCIDCGVRTNGFGEEYKFCQECVNQ